MNKKQFLAMSLPYELKGIANVNSICSLRSIDFTENEYGVRFGYDILTFTRDYFNPILHPLSDLTKSIEHKGKTIHVLSYLCEKYRHIKPDMLLHAITSGIIDLNIALDLVEFHFDIAGLIGKGEAIDVNTLEINPYK